MEHAATPLIMRATATALLIATMSAIAIGDVQTRAKAETPDAPTTRLIDALELREGSIVAEMGAGSGVRTIAIARHIGASGRIYTTELGSSNLEKLRKAVEGAGVQNATFVEALAAETNLPEQCCDALFMENVYHHFPDPAAMDVSIFRAVRPGGRVAVVDFTPPAEAARPEDRDTDGHHGVTPATVQAELEKAGFELIKVDQIEKRGFLVVMRKPVR